MAGLILQIQAEALEPSASVSTLLRKVKVAAVKLNVTDALPWVDLELSGYSSDGKDKSDLPSYRKLMGTLRVKNPYHGLQPLHFGNPKHAREFSKANIGQSLPELEAVLATRDEGLQFTLSPHVAKMLMDSMDIALEPVLLLSRASVAGIVESVRNLVVEWSLEMEKAGVLGEGMTFSQRERDIAAPATQQFNIQNLGVLGNVTDHAQVSNHQTAIKGIDQSALRSMLDQLSALHAQLPTPTREKLMPVVADLQKEAISAAPDQSKIRGLLLSAKMICEGAAGNLVASGVVAAITSLLH